MGDGTDLRIVGDSGSSRLGRTYQYKYDEYNTIASNSHLCGAPKFKVDEIETFTVTNENPPLKPNFIEYAKN